MDTEKDDIESSTVKILIEYIQKMIDFNHELLEVIKNPKLLINNLKELDLLVEMDDIKSSIVKQIQMMIVMAHKRKNDGDVGPRFDNHMLHGVIYGPPGVGKSSAAKTIAKIFHSVGVMDQMDKNKSEISLNKKKFFFPPSPPSIKSCDQYEMSDSIAHEAGEMLVTINEFREQTKKSIVKLKDEIEEDDTLEELNKMLDNSNDIGFKCTNILSLCQNRKKIISGNELHEYEIKDKTEDSYEMSNVIENKERVVVCGRADLVGEYAGQTAPKTLKFLNKNIGNVIVIEEAYLLYTGDRDQFGMESLTEINRFMDEHASEIIIYLTGYKKLMEKTIFKAQPGLKRRCEQVFDIQGYTPDGLSRIFRQQMSQNGWSLSPDVDLKTFFDKKSHHFENYGGDTLKLAFQCKQCYSSDIFKNFYECDIDEDKIPDVNLVINQEIFENAMDMFLKNVVLPDEIDNKKIPEGMYS